MSATSPATLSPIESFVTNSAPWDVVSKLFAEAGVGVYACKGASTAMRDAKFEIAPSVRFARTLFNPPTRIVRHYDADSVDSVDSVGNARVFERTDVVYLDELLNGASAALLADALPHVREVTSRRMFDVAGMVHLSAADLDSVAYEKSRVEVTMRNHAIERVHALATNRISDGVQRSAIPDCPVQRARDADLLISTFGLDGGDGGNDGDGVEWSRMPLLLAACDAAQAEMVHMLVERLHVDVNVRHPRHGNAVDVATRRQHKHTSTVDDARLRWFKEMASSDATPDDPVQDSLDAILHTLAKADVRGTRDADRAPTQQRRGPSRRVRHSMP